MDLFCCFCPWCFVLSVSCSLVVTCWEGADLWALLYVAFPCDFVTFPFDVLGQVWYLIVSIPDLCLLHNFEDEKLFLALGPTCICKHCN